MHPFIKRGVFAFVLTMAVPAAMASEDWLEEAERHYLQGEYLDAKKIVEAHRGEGEALSTERRADFYLLNARIAAADGQNLPMRQWLEKLYEVDPERELDVYVDPPLLYHAWSEIQSDHEDEEEDDESDHHHLPFGLPSEEQIKGEAQYWVSLIPFGVGHFNVDETKSGFYFLALDFSLAYAAIDLPQNKWIRHEGLLSEASWFGLSAFAGAWGYEITDLMPALHRRNAGYSERLRYGLSFVPFGAAQAKNGQFGKALGFAAVETGLWALALTSSDQTARSLGFAGVALSYFYGAYDGWIHHMAWPEGQPTKQTSLDIRPIVAPSGGGGRGVYGLNVTYRW